MLENLYWLGHASFRLDTDKVIYFDPWKLPPHSKKADIILITHEHFDHYSLEDIRLISSKETTIVTSKEVGRQLQKEKAIYKEVKSLSPGDKVEVEGIKIDALKSYNTNKTFHTKESQKLGFIINVEGVKIYHSGDTDFISEMEGYLCDIALLPVSGTYVMTADEAARAALLISPKVAIPMHYGDIVGTESDAERFLNLLKGKVEVSLLKKER